MQGAGKTLVCIPTYNEAENITPLLRAVFSVAPENLDVLVIDDNSPDGTAGRVEELQASEPWSSRVHLLKRSGKQGLGKAYLAGFDWALTRGFDYVVEMDADFSHRPEDLVELDRAVRMPGRDFAVGSRYVPGGRTVNWGLLRKLISRGGSLYSRLILGFPLNDWTGGFNAWSRQALEKMGLSEVQSNGYSFQIELKYRALRRGQRGVEVPIVFEDRRVGQSKMSGRIVLEALHRVWRLRLSIQ
jgi:dolichol-phosphate mannosyltransferase